MKWGPGVGGGFIEPFVDIQTDVVLSGLVNIKSVNVIKKIPPLDLIITAPQIRFNIILHGISP